MSSDYWNKQTEIITENVIGSIINSDSSGFVSSTSAHLISNLGDEKWLIAMSGRFIYKESNSKKFSYFNMVIRVSDSVDKMKYLDFMLSLKGMAGYMSINEFLNSNGIFLDRDQEYSYIDEDLFSVKLFEKNFQSFLTKCARRDRAEIIVQTDDRTNK